MKTTTAQSYRVLLADDQADIRDSLRLLLKTEGYETQGVASPTEAINAIEAREFDAVLMDLNYARDTTSGQEGLDLLTRIQVLASRPKTASCARNPAPPFWPIPRQWLRSWN